MQSRAAVLALLVLACACLAGAQQTPAVILYEEVVSSGTIGSNTASMQYVLYIPVNDITNTSVAATVTTYLNNAGATSPELDRWPVVYFSEEANPGPGSTNVTEATKAPQQTAFIEGDFEANYQMPVDPYAYNGPTYPVFRVFAGVFAPGLQDGESTSFTISYSLVKDLIDPKLAVSESDDGVFSYYGTLSSGIRHYFEAYTATESMIKVEMCTTNEANGMGNPVPLAFIYNRKTDVNTEDAEQTQWARETCQATYNSESLVVNPSNAGSSGYVEVCPLYAHFTEAVSPVRFALDVSYWWNQFPALDGTVSYQVTIYTQKMLSMPFAQAGSIANAEVVESYLYQDGPNLQVNFVPAVLGGGVDGSSESLPDAKYTIYSDVTLDDATREQMVAEKSMNSACFLLERPSLMLSDTISEAQLSASEELGGTSRMIVLEDFFKDRSPPTFPYHVAVVMTSDRYDAAAYSFVDVEETTPVGAGLGFWGIVGIIVGVLAVLVVVVAIVGGAAYIVYSKKKNSNYDVME